MTRSVNFFVNVNPKESSEKRLSRFKQWFNRSRVGNTVKSRRYRPDKLRKSKRKMRDSALMRSKYRAERERKKFYL
jgi:ribosomal protein S21